MLGNLLLGLASMKDSVSTNVTIYITDITTVQIWSPVRNNTAFKTVTISSEIRLSMCMYCYWLTFTRSLIVIELVSLSTLTSKATGCVDTFLFTFIIWCWAAFINVCSAEERENNINILRAKYYQEEITTHYQEEIIDDMYHYFHHISPVNEELGLAQWQFYSA